MATTSTRKRKGRARPSRRRRALPLYSTEFPEPPLRPRPEQHPAATRRTISLASSALGGVMLMLAFAIVAKHLKDTALPPAPPAPIAKAISITKDQIRAMDGRRSE